MTKKNIKILAIDPGMRNIGVAILDGQKLLYYSVKTIERKKNSAEVLKEAREIISQLIDDFKPQVMAIEKTHFAYKKKKSWINLLVKQIKALRRKRRLTVEEYSTNTIRKIICNNGRASKEDVAKVLVTKYPELKIYLKQDKKWKEKYWRNVFDAVAVGVSYQSLK